MKKSLCKSPFFLTYVIDTFRNVLISKKNLIYLSSESRLAKTHPADPAPTIIWLYRVESLLIPGKVCKDWIPNFMLNFLLNVSEWKIWHLDVLMWETKIVNTGFCYEIETIIPPRFYSGLQSGLSSLGVPGVPLLLAPPDFQTCLRPCIPLIGWPSWSKISFEWGGHQKRTKTLRIRT